MHVLHWYPNFCAGGGVANSVLGLADAQASIGIDVSIVGLASGSGIYGPLAPRGDVVVQTWRHRTRLGRGNMRLHLMSPATARSIRSAAPDIVHVHAEFNPDNWWAPRLWNCPLVVSPHGAFHKTVLERGHRQKGLYIAIAQRALYRHAARFHALSPAEAADIEAALPGSRTYCATQGPSPALSATRHLLRGGIARLPDEPIRFMFVGRIDTHTKGLDILLEGFAKAVRDSNVRRSATVTLVGPDWRKGKGPLRQLARRLGIEDRVDIRDRVPQGEVPRLLESCDVYVQLSRHESSPLSINDALALGKPVIVSNRVGTVSWSDVADFPHVRVVEPSVASASNAIGDILANFESLRQSADKSHPQVLEFLDWERVARRHLEEYASLLATAPPPEPREETELVETG